MNAQHRAPHGNATPASGAWAVVLVRHDGKRRTFMEFSPDAEGKARAVRLVRRLRELGCEAELVAHSQVAGMGLRR